MNQNVVDEMRLKDLVDYLTMYYERKLKYYDIYRTLLDKKRNINPCNQHDVEFIEKEINEIKNQINENDYNIDQLKIRLNKLL